MSQQVSGNNRVDIFLHLKRINRRRVDNTLKNIMINGRGGSGKSEIAKYLVDKYGYKEIILAEPIYEIAKEYFNMESKNRELLQDIGQKLREIDEDIWVNYLINSLNENQPYVLSDVRQSNEYDSFFNEGFIPIQVRADLNKRIDRIEKRDNIKIDNEYIARLENNKAEIGADDKEYYYIIDNNGTIDELYEGIDTIVKGVEGTPCI